MKNTNTKKDRLNRRKEFADWRKKKGVSYQAIVTTVNAAAEKVGLSTPERPVLKYPTVAAWGTRGTVPGPEAAKALSLIYRDIPILKGVVVQS